MSAAMPAATEFQPDPDVLMPDGETHFIIGRTLDAPRDLVFRMYSSPEHMRHFWGPHGSTTPVCEVDFRPGGVWHYVMRFPDGNEFGVTSVYLDIAAPERIVFRDAPEAMRRGPVQLPPPTMITTIALADVGGRTRVTTTVRMNSVAERDAAVANGFAGVVLQAAERFDVYVKTLEGRASW